MSSFRLKTIESVLSSPTVFEGSALEVSGWVLSARHSKKVSFLMLSDGSSCQPMQVVVSDAVRQAHPDVLKMTTGSSARISGTLVASQGSKQSHELLAETFDWIGLVEEPLTYPLPPKELTAEHIRSVPHLRARLPQQAAIARLRSVLASAVDQYFQRLDFVWVATPVLSSSDAEGAGARFRVTTTAPGEQDVDADFFSKPTYLTVSGQLEGEALCSALSRVYTFGPTFRAERSHTSRHLAEFWMIEPEMSFATLDDLIELSDGLIRHCIRTCLEQLPQEMALFEKDGGRSIQEWSDLAETSIAKMTYTQAVEQLQKHFDDVSWGVDLHSEHEKWLVAQAGRPLAITHYPEAIKSFYMKGSSGETVEAMDILVPDMGELIGGSVREHDFDKLVYKMKQCGMPIEEYQHYLDLRRYGSVPHGGFGLGFERLIGYLSSSASVKDVIAYPKTAG